MLFAIAATQNIELLISLLFSYVSCFSQWQVSCNMYPLYVQYSILYLVLFAASCGSACVRGCMSTEASVEDSTAQIVTVQLYYYYSVTWPSWPLYSQYTIHCAFCTFKMHQIQNMILKCLSKSVLCGDNIHFGDLFTNFMGSISIRR